MDLRNLPLRLTAGAFILNSGVGKLSSDEEAAAGTHGMAAAAYPFLDQFTPRVFVKALATSEIALGAALIVPILPRTLVATGFTAFSAGLVGLYLRTPSLRRGKYDPRPSAAGVGVAKDIMMFGAATSFLLDSVRQRRERRRD